MASATWKPDSGEAGTGWTRLDLVRDLVVWHPCTQMKDHEWLPMIPIERGEGVWLHGYDGRRYLDAISSG
jgi:adenosylmethionine-8-amino-7-oxononanoate aminotransferase